jgi:signal recognition particle subunit SRP54
VVSLVEKAQQTFDEDEARRLNAKMRKNQFDFNDFLSQLDQVKKMGNMKDMLSMIPGMGKAMKDVDFDENAFKPVEAIIKSMTLKERSNPEILNSSRKNRLAKGSGTSIQQVNQLIKQFDDMRKMMKTMNKMGGAKRALSAMNPFGR